MAYVLCPTYMSKKTVFSTPWFSVESLEYPEHGITSENSYYRLVENDGVIVLGMTRDERIVIVRQFRPALGQYSLELPAGGIGPGESPAEAARREFYEETGYRANKLVKLNQGMYVSVDRTNKREFAFLARDITKDESFKPKENIQVEEVKLTEFRTMVFENKFPNLILLGVILLWLWGDKSKSNNHIR